MEKRYLGDGVYAEFGGYAIVLTTENGISVTSRIVLELQEMLALAHYIEDVAKQLRNDES